MIIALAEPTTHNKNMVVSVQKSTSENMIVASKKRRALNQQQQQDDESSTVSVCSSAPRPKRQRRKNCVRFDEKSNSSYSNNMMFKDESRQLWISQVEYDGYRKSAAVHLRQTLQCEILDLHLDPNSCTFSKVVQRTYNVCCDSNNQAADHLLLSHQDTKNLQALFANPHDQDHIGLERMLVRSIANDRVLRRKQLVRVISRIQSMDSTNWEHSKEEIIQALCEEITRGSRLFAQCLAYAAHVCEM